jgi:hypothetical protein
VEAACAGARVASESRTSNRTAAIDRSSLMIARTGKKESGLLRCWT